MEPAYLGIDLHKAFFQVCAVNARGERQWEQRWPTTDLGIAALLTRCDGRSQVEVEASSPTWAFVDRIVNQVGVIHVVSGCHVRTAREDSPRAPAGWLGKPAARAQDSCVFDFTSRFMNVFVSSMLSAAVKLLRAD